MSNEGKYGSSMASNLPRVTLAEAIGTFVLVFIGTAVAVVATLKSPIAGTPAGSLAVALAFGLILVTLVNAFGPISGGHFNPAVTIALAFAGVFPWKYVLPYIVAQMSGAMFASIVVRILFGIEASTVAALGATQPADGVGDWTVFLAELIGTGNLMLAIALVVMMKRIPQELAGQSIGFALFGSILAIGPLTGGGFNPARALASMLLSGQMDAWHMYVAGPIVGAVLIALIVKFLLGAVNPSEAESK